MAAKPRTDPAAWTEAELSARAVAGEHEAFAQVMTRCNQRLFRLARSVVRDESEAEDVLQEAYVRAFAAIGGFRGEAGLSTWLSRIVLNEARGRLRRRRPTAPLSALDDAQEKGAEIIMFPGFHPAASPEADAARAQSRRLMEAAIDDLPEPFRLVFILRAVEDCSIEETAAQLGIRPETVKTRLHRARKLLAQALHDRLASSVTEAFPFLGERCAAITAKVMARLGEA